MPTIGLEFPVHIPACFLGREELTEPESAIRYLAVRLQGADFKIGVWLETPVELLNLPTPLRPMRVTAIVGAAVLNVLEEAKPRFHYSVLNDELVRTAGTTIAVTGRTKDRKNTIVATWDYGESFLKAFSRLNSMRKLLAAVPPDLAANLLFQLRNPVYPPPQVLLSNVLELERPDMALGSAPGASPIAIAVGSKLTHLVFDHRLYDPVDEAEFVARYNEQLRGVLSNEQRQRMDTAQREYAGGR